MYLRVSVDNVTCHWVRVSAVMNTLEWTALAKVDLLHYYLSPAEQVGPASQTCSFTSVCLYVYCLSLLTGAEVYEICSLSVIVSCFIAICLQPDCVPACVHGQCNSSLGVCECSDGYTGVDCSSKGRFVALL